MWEWETEDDYDLLDDLVSGNITNTTLESNSLKENNNFQYDLDNSNKIDSLLDELNEEVYEQHIGDSNKKDLVNNNEEFSLLTDVQYDLDVSVKGSEDSLVSLHNRELGLNRENFPNKKVEIDKDDLKDSYYKEDAIKRSVGTPLDNDVTRNLVISSDGRTLSEYIFNKRVMVGKSLPEKSREMAHKIVQGDLEPWESNIYKRRYKKEQDKKKQRKIKRTVQKGDFLEINKRHNVKEQRILKALGITGKDLMDIVSPSSNVDEETKARLLSIGEYGEKDRGIKQRVYAHKTIGDYNILYFLDKFRIARLSQIAVALGKNLTSVSGQLNKLNKLGLLNNILIYGSSGVWTLSKTGRALIGSTRKPLSKKQTTPYALSERLLVNHVASCLWSNSINILQLDGEPYKGRLFEGEYVSGEDMITETDMMSSMQKKIIDIKQGVFVKDKYKGQTTKELRENWEITWRTWEHQGRPVNSPELLEGNEYLYILFDESDLTASYVLPDLVVKRPRDYDGTPNNIAIEVEKKIGTVEDYVKKLMGYKLDDRVYSKVIYITHLSTVADRIVEAAEKINFDRYEIVPLLDSNGEITNKADAWLI